MKLATLPLATDSTMTAPPSPTAATDSNGRRGKRRRWTVAERVEHLAGFTTLGLTQAKYCRQRGLSPATFSLWCRQARARGETPTGGAGEQDFAEVVLTPLAGNAPDVARSVHIHVRASSRDRAIRRGHGHGMTAIQPISRARFAQGAKAHWSLALPPLFRKAAW